MRKLTFQIPKKKFEIIKKMIPVLKITGVIFCVVLFLPYIITVFVRGIDEAEKLPVLTGPVITILTEKGTQSIPTDEYLCGLLAQYYDKGYTREELKAICIILRSNFLYNLEANKNFYDIWSYQERRENWGQNFPTYEREVRNIISETAGKILLKNGKIEEITMCEFSHDGSDCESILQTNYADYAIYQYF
ncbi:MAG: hypothetical protein K2K96_06775 [Lachnospiraceae bacterium]|nr:hypothetical protein [Lachnospiraceae bacterium]